MQTEDNASNRSFHPRIPGLLSAFICVCLAACLIFMGGCTNTFGVQPEVWKTLDEEQKNKIIDEYYEKEREERQIEKEERTAQKLREKRLLQSLDRDAYFPDQVLYGRLFGGQFRHDDDYYHFEPVHFSIAYGEIKPIEIELNNGKCIKLYIEYADDEFLFDVSLTDLDRDRARTFSVKKQAREGVHFTSFNTSNESPIDGVRLNLNLRLVKDPDAHERKQ